MSKFEPKVVECILKTDSFKIECTTKHEFFPVGQKSYKTANTYRFTGRPLTYLIKNEADYNELMANPNFRDFVKPGEKLQSQPSETSKERKLRKQKEAEENKKKAELKIIPSEQTDGIDSITDRPGSE